jgi:hypothetical protein
MQENNDTRRVVTAVLLAIAMIPAGRALAADADSTSKPRVVILCPECGVVSDIRRIEKPVAPERNMLQNLPSSSHAGATGNETRAVPLISLGPSGPQRVQREPTSRNVWEVSVRYDSGQFGFVTLEMEPELKIGDRVRHVEHTLEYIAPQAR